MSKIHSQNKINGAQAERPSSAANGHVLGDYDKWYKKCDNCGYDPGRSAKNRCWRCGRMVHRDFSERALKIDKKK